MVKRLRFGPAGKPIDLKGADYVKAIEYIAEVEKLDALEYEAVRGVRISEKKALEIRSTAEKYDVKLSMHAPYFINLASPNENTIKRSIERLQAALKAASTMNAYVVVFHVGYYKDNPSKKHAIERAIASLKTVEEWMKSNGINNTWLSPETTGKQTQIGDLNEVVQICKEVDACKPTVDWAHIYARYLGNYIKSVDHVVRVIEFIEKELGIQALKPLHTHFSRIEYGNGGEKEHHTLAEKDYGPDFEIVCKGLVETGVEAVIISESPLLDKDAIVMRNLCCSICQCC